MGVEMKLVSRDTFVRPSRPALLTGSFYSSWPPVFLVTDGIQIKVYSTVNRLCLYTRYRTVHTTTVTCLPVRLIQAMNASSSSFEKDDSSSSHHIYSLKRGAPAS